MKWLLLIIGGILFGSGVELFIFEAQIFDARFAARDGRPAPLTSSPSKLEQAYDTLASKSRARSDVAETALDLAIELEARKIPGGFVSTAEREERVSRAARDFLTLAPGAGQGWCISAIAESRAGYPEAGAQYLRRCYELAPREVSLYEGRINLSLALWDNLPKDVRMKALEDAASGIRDGHFGGWTLERLAYAVAVVAPRREPLVRTMVETSRPDAVVRFDQYLKNFREQKSQGKLR